MRINTCACELTSGQTNRLANKPSDADTFGECCKRLMIVTWCYCSLSRVDAVSIWHKLSYHNLLPRGVTSHSPICLSAGNISMCIRAYMVLSRRLKHRMTARLNITATTRRDHPMMYGSTWPSSSVSSWSVVGNVSLVVDILDELVGSP